MSVILNSELINKVRVTFIEMLGQAKLMNFEVEMVDQDLIPGVVLSVSRVMNGVAFSIDSVIITLRDYELVNPTLSNRVIAKTLAFVLHEKESTEFGIADLLAGLSTGFEFESPVGLIVKFSKDTDSQVLLIQEATAPHHTVYALEEAVNMDLSMSPELMSKTESIERRVWFVMADYILADRVVREISFE